MITVAADNGIGCREVCINTNLKERFRDEEFMDIDHDRDCDDSGDVFK